jgi:secreted trypsin-like serine protease
MSEYCINFSLVFEQSKMKFLAFATIFLAVHLASGGNVEFVDSRVTGGSNANSGLIKCYVALQIDTENLQQKTCGGCLLLPQNKVITAANCVFSVSEGKATAIRFYTGLSGPAGSPNTQFRVDDIFKPAGFDVSSNSSGSDVAIITLKSSISSSSTIQGAWPSSEDKPDAFLGENLVVCGHGFIDNNRTRPGSRGLQCTTLRVVPVKECVALVPKPTTTVAPTTAAPTTAAGATATPAPPPKGMICARNVDDRNVCGGDQGSPVFSNMTGQLQLVGIVSYYPDARPNARCRDGHAVVITQIGNYEDFIQNPK